MFGAMWSEHCAYKHSRPLLGRLPIDGAARARRARARTPARSTSAMAWPSSSRSSRTTIPSAVEPYQGAATGVGGIIRDIFTMGARPDRAPQQPALRPARARRARPMPTRRARNRYLFGGVVGGIAGYGNCIGIPDVGGEVAFDASLLGQPARQRDVRRHRPPRRDHPGPGGRRRATSCCWSAPRPVATGSRAPRSPRPRSATTARSGGRRSRSATRSSRSCSWRPASSWRGSTAWSPCRTSARPG